MDRSGVRGGLDAMITHWIDRHPNADRLVDRAAVRWAVDRALDGVRIG
jgi:hypothetical protein